MSMCIGFPNSGYTSYQAKTPFQSSLVELCRMRAVAGVGHVETIQTWRAAPCDYPPTYSAELNNSILSSNIVYFTLL